jgi:hypothetical protein
MSITHIDHEQLYVDDAVAQLGEVARKRHQTHVSPSILLDQMSRLVRLSPLDAGFRGALQEFVLLGIYLGQVAHVPHALDVVWVTLGSIPYSRVRALQDLVVRYVLFNPLVESTSPHHDLEPMVRHIALEAQVNRPLPNTPETRTQLSEEAESLIEDVRERPWAGVQEKTDEQWMVSLSVMVETVAYLALYGEPGHLERVWNVLKVTGVLPEKALALAAEHLRCLNYYKEHGTANGWRVEELLECTFHTSSDEE